MASGIQAVMTGLFGFYNTIFQPLLAAGPYVALGFFSAALAGLFSLIYWHLLDIDKQDKLKNKISKHQDKMKEARKENAADKASEHMQKTMELNQKMMMLNMKPMIATMVFVALVFPWLGATFAPTVDVNKVDNSTFTGQMVYAGQSEDITVINKTEPVVKVDNQTAKIGEELEIHGFTWEVTRFGEKSGGWFSDPEGYGVNLNGVFVRLPFSMPLAGSDLNWLGFYILIAMPLTFIFRKALGVA